MVKAFQEIFKRTKFWRILTDEGKEFVAGKVQSYFKEQEILHYCVYTSPRFHCGMVERCNRTIKERMFRYFTENKTKKWIDVIQQIAHDINHCRNRVIGMRPCDVTLKNAEQLRKRLAEKALLLRDKVHFKVGDKVRIEDLKHVFEKGYAPNFTEKLYRVSWVRVYRKPVTYRLETEQGLPLAGWFYNNDLCRVKE